jgi:hypothetical protein
MKKQNAQKRVDFDEPCPTILENTMQNRVAKFKNNPTIDEFADLLCSDRFGTGLGRVGFKFVRSMLVGIHRTRSVNLTNVAKGLNENIRLHATHKRLSRNLDDPGLTTSLSDRLLKLGARRVGRNTRLIVHVYELNKKYACKMEYLPKSDFDSDTGFKVCEILASDPESEYYTPLLATVWSEQVPGYKSDADEIKKALHRVFRATNNQGMLYFDDVSLPGKMLQPIIQEPGLNFAALMRGVELDVIHGGEVFALQSLVEDMETRYGKIMFKLVPEGIVGSSKTDLDLFVHVGAIAIKLPECDRKFSLIALKSKNRLMGELSTPLITSKTNLRSRKALMGLVESFLSMQDVLEAHQALLASFDPAGFRVLTYNRLQLLMTLLQAVIHYETSMLGNFSMSDPHFALKPHDGKLQRTYYQPDQQET